ncbi:MAG TPA: outer membrane protein assembly factor BamD, partial [Rhizobiales bacterium]|nr:outer membrane protein assembly factor BamD [Hyphomicrobiales bacterium]
MTSLPGAIARILRLPGRGVSVSGILGRASMGVLVAALLALSGCSAGKDKDNYVERPVDDIYNNAMALMKREKYKKAAKEFEEVERQHPYSTWASRALVMAAYSYYEANKYDDAILAAKRYISLHPGGTDAAYANYLVAASQYEQITDVGRDQKVTRQALKSLEEVVRKFPDSDYAKDAKLKIDLARDHLAGKEMEIGRYYIKKKAYLSAINRFKVVVKKYQTTTHIEEALMRLTELYMTLGITSEAQTAAAVLGHNYPGSKWYEDAYSLLKSGGL